MCSYGKNNVTAEEDELFYFESDHLALKGNAEYSELLKTMFILEAQRKRAIDDYNTVIQLRKDVDNNPMEMVNKLANGDGLGVPDLQVITEVPKIDWLKYNIKIPDQLLRTVNSSEEQEDGGLKPEDLKLKISKNTHSKPWTIEEQKKLEELLVVFPPEEVELRRLKKIAAALGTRTVTQVCSRVQKYFVKLKKAGLPVPGRIPRFTMKKGMHKHQQSNYYNIKPSTFFPNLNIPVAMNENEDVPGPSQCSSPFQAACSTNSTNYLLNSNYHSDKSVEHRKSDTELQLIVLKQIRIEKLYENSDDTCLFQHIGYKCDYCEEEPISGSRWHCITCQATSVDYCTDCMLSQMYATNRHSLTHRFLIIRDEEHSANLDVSGDQISGKASSSSSSDDTSSEIDSDELEDFIKCEAAEDSIKNVSSVKMNGVF